MSRIADEQNPLLNSIARVGEPMYAAIIRNRSGINSRRIDMGVRCGAITDLGPEQKDCINTAFALLDSVLTSCDKENRRDSLWWLERIKDRILEP